MITIALVFSMPSFIPVIIICFRLRLLQWLMGFKTEKENGLSQQQKKKNHDH